MAGEWKKRAKASSWGLLSNHRYLCKKAMMLRAMESARACKKRQQKQRNDNVKRKRTDSHNEPRDVNEPTKGANIQKYENKSTAAHETGYQQEVKDTWEVDSGFSEASLPTSGRSSPCPDAVVALDCEMVGTGPGGRCSELARCSILDYHGDVLYDKYVQPCHPVTDYRTRWSGIRRHHLRDATPFAQAIEEILSILEDKVVVGHSVYNDFDVLDMVHPAHMVRDTAASHHLAHLAGFPRQRCASLKIMAKKLLNRHIQVGKSGHCSVEDARASLDLYKLVEDEWERELQSILRGDDDHNQPIRDASMEDFMQDRYWPHHLTSDCLEAEHVGDAD
ncbi:apoptosis-enhancing nuclease-like [Dunckerocampus dactyliophorus]|uniref:apoptosis-enhancing nuclease-like n=1 Tax=Dunckerocampus dactyliophorus TaxID=161453 RepID=UPI0024073B40|nr:apoptosis-enhancing nuclease-like [Dunckerocampus dactyliophorus]XP_054632734.1 apoptosis-enhancing nuclease-like [Dunckerocampus dactyliophorus]